MRAGDNHQHDLVGGFQRADTMDHQCIEHFPAATRLIDDFGDRLFGHAGIMLQRHGGDAGAFVDIAHHADKAGNGADFRIAATHRCQFGTDIKILLVDAHAHRISLRSPAEKMRPHRHP